MIQTLVPPRVTIRRSARQRQVLLLGTLTLAGFLSARAPAQVKPADAPAGQKEQNVQVPDELRVRLEASLGSVQSGLAEINRTLAAFETTLERLTAVAEAGSTAVSNSVRALQTGFLPVLERYEQQWQTTLATLKQEREAFTRDFRTERTAITQSLDTNLVAVLQAMEREVGSLLKALEKERAAVLLSVEQERAAILQDVDRIVRDTTERSWKHLRATVKEVLFYAVLLVLIVLGLPFFFGYLVGRATRAKAATPSGPARWP